MSDTDRTDILTQAQQAILRERELRKYHVVVTNVRRAEYITEIPLPPSIEAYWAETRCTEKHHHNIPCLWVDLAVHMPDGTWKVVFMNSLVRPGMTVEQGVQALISELIHENRKMAINEISQMAQEEGMDDG
jgi:hypothetical protein